MKRVIALATLLVLLMASSAFGADLRWSWQNPKPQGNDLWSITYGAGLFVTVGDGGVILTSPDAKTWTLQSSPTRASLRSVTFADGRFVAVGGNLPADAEVPSDQIILTSTDGQNWTTALSASGPALFGAAYGQGRFVAVGGCAWPTPQKWRSVLTSTDGLTWQSPPNSMESGFCGVTFGQGRFVAVSAQGRSAVFTSADGTNWKLTSTAGNDEFDGLTWRGVAFGSGQFAVVQNYGHVRTSTDGEHWSAGQVIGSGPFKAEMSYAGDRFFALGEGVSSKDGITWTPMKIYGHSVAYGAGLYVIVGEGGQVATSVDGENWQPVTPPKLPAVNAITYVDGKYVAVGYAMLSLTSPDGAGWQVSKWQTDIDHDWQAINFTDVAYGNGKLVALNSTGGNLDTSTDGLAWHSTWFSMIGGIGGTLLFANGQFLAGTPKGLVSSTDGEQWKVAYPGDQSWFRGIAWDGARYVAIISNWEQKPTLLTSPDGASWQEQPLATDPLLSMAYGNGKFVAVGVRQGRPATPDQPGEPNTFYLLTSADALNWTAGQDVPFETVRFDHGLFLALTREGALYTSANGEEWRLQPTAASVTGAAFLNGRLVTTGRSGSILFSEPVCGIFLDLPAADAACPAVTALVARRVVDGYPDGSFRPEGTVTRAETAKMLTLALNEAPQPGGSLPYRDTAGHWAARGGYLQTAYSVGAMQGYPDHTFRPDGQITRAELVKTVLAAAGIPPAATGTTDYNDVIPTEWFAPWVAAAEQAGLIGSHAKSGLWSDASFMPNLPANRAEAARLLATLLP